MQGAGSVETEVERQGVTLQVKVLVQGGEPINSNDLEARVKLLEWQDGPGGLVCPYPFGQVGFRLSFDSQAVACAPGAGQQSARLGAHHQGAGRQAGVRHAVPEGLQVRESHFICHGRERRSQGIDPGSITYLIVV